ncbi:cyclophilin-like fold protein [Eubacteriaceae bacterium ES3]|nr:cyclophilin-like fold protein [Eubacteriaceae bacterium ES3]
MKIQVKGNGNTIVYQLNDSLADESLYSQLPMAIKVENYSNDEKIFYPAEKLKTSNTPKANAKNGSLAYYAPWGNVVMYYKDFGKASGLYELGQVVSGKENISKLSGEIQIEILKD